MTNTANSIFKAQGDNIEAAGMVRVMADFAKAAYNLNHPNATEYTDINDISAHSTEAYKETLSEQWTPLVFSSLSPVLDKGIIKSGMTSDGFYINGNAAALVERCGDAVVLSFRGTNDYSDKSGIVNPYDPNDTNHPDYDQWTNMPAHYSLLSPLINALDSYVANAANGISKVYVTGHSMGGAMALEYMSQHSGNKYQAITFAASPFGDALLFLIPFRKSYASDSRITQVEIEKDTAPMMFDQPNLLGDTNIRPGHLISFAGNKTLNLENRISKAMGLIDYWGRTANHSMDYYRQITDSVDGNSWGKILAASGTQSVLLAGEQVTGTGTDKTPPNFIVDGQKSGTNTSVNNGDDILSGNGFNVIYGGKGNDTLKAAGNNNTQLLGGVGNDTLIGGTGNDTVDGGDGSDRAVLDDIFTHYVITLDATTHVVKMVNTTAKSTDTFINVESFQFKDATKTLNQIYPSLNKPASVAITGTPTQGQTLTATIMDADGVPSPSGIIYTWKAGSTIITGATGNTFTLTQAQVGKTITASASFTDNLGTAETPISLATTAVTAPAVVNTPTTPIYDPNNPFAYLLNNMPIVPGTLTGTSGDDYLIAAPTDTILQAGAGNDILQPGKSDAGRWSVSIDDKGVITTRFTGDRADAAGVFPQSTTTAFATINGTGVATDPRISWIYQSPEHIKDVAWLVHGALGRLPTLSEMGALVNSDMTRDTLGNLAYQAWSMVNPNVATMNTPAKVQALGQQLFGSPLDNSIVTAVQGFLNAGGTWGQIMLIAAESPLHTNRISKVNGNASGFALINNDHLNEAGWGNTGSTNRQLLGGVGNDILVGTGGNNTLDGGTGTDMAVFTGRLADYGIYHIGTDSFVTNHATGAISTLRSIELLEIGGQVYNLDSTGAVTLVGNHAPATAGAFNAAWQ